MKKILQSNGIYLEDKQVMNLRQIIPYHSIDKFIPLIKSISEIPIIDATFTIDDLTWFFICQEAAKRKISPKVMVRYILSKEISKDNPTYKLIYPIIKALLV